jgi:hypothetical protein
MRGLMAAVIGLAAAAGAVAQQAPREQAPRENADCVHQTLVSSKVYALVARTFLSDNEPEDDVATAKLQLADAVRACTQKGGLSEGQAAAMEDIGLFGAAIDYLGDELVGKGATRAAVDSLRTVLAPFSAQDIDRFYEADWRSDLAFMGRVKGELKSRGVPDNEMAMELGFQLIEFAAKRAQSEYLFGISKGETS